MYIAEGGKVPMVNLDEVFAPGYWDAIEARRLAEAAMVFGPTAVYGTAVPEIDALVKKDVERRNGLVAQFRLQAAREAHV